MKDKPPGRWWGVDVFLQGPVHDKEAKLMDLALLKKELDDMIAIRARNA